MNEAIHKITEFLKDRFNLSGDRAHEEEIVSEIRRSVEFKGVNVWVLIFAIMVASIGLNVNSTAVIIGAMLISPLMGPIMGVGLGVGISDIELIKKSGKNLAIMVVISVLTSAVYFFASPLQEAKSELLNRTTPTIYDVFIALFGGLAGIVATSSRERGNVIPGVAIATALMPPLCTAGYGIAIGSLRYFAGAFYLFTINTVFICFSTLLIVRFLRFHEVSFLSPQAKQRVRTIVWVLVAAMIIPSTYIARNLILESIFEKKVNEFIREEFRFTATEIIKHEHSFSPKKEIKISLYGEPLDSNTIANLRNQLPSYDLENTKLIIKQNEKSLDVAAIKTHVMETYLEINLDSLRSKDRQIAQLTGEIAYYRNQLRPIDKLAREAHFFDTRIQTLSSSSATVFDTKGQPLDTLAIVWVKYASSPNKKDMERLTEWLKVRLETDKIKMVLE